MAANHLQQTFESFRRQLALGEQAFDRWQASFGRFESDITRRLEHLNGRLGKASSRPRLRVVTLDEIAAL
jgi:hypothetical protein